MHMHYSNSGKIQNMKRQKRIMPYDLQLPKSRERAHICI